MQTHNNDLYVTRNETFTIRKRIENRNGSPYIISSELNNPYWLIAVTNSKYGQANRYVYNKWLNLKNELRFKITRPVNVSELGYEDFLDMPLPDGFEGDETSGYAGIAVFTNGIKYMYWQYENDDADDFNGTWEEYKCYITTTFNSVVTSKWIEQVYYYTIQLVSGESTLDNLNVIAESLGIEHSDDVPYLYNKIQEINPELLSHIEDVGRPIVNFDAVYNILSPKKIYVNSNTKGAMI